MSCQNTNHGLTELAWYATETYQKVWLCINIYTCKLNYVIWQPESFLIFFLIYSVHYNILAEILKNAQLIYEPKFTNVYNFWMVSGANLGHCNNNMAVLGISTCSLNNVSVKSVGRVQIIDYSPILRVQF